MTESENAENMVLRTVFFPPTLDDELKRLALAHHCSKNELIREYLRGAIERAKEEKASVEPRIAPAPGLG